MFAALQKHKTVLRISFALTFIVLIFSSSLTNSGQIEAQSDPFSSSSCAKLAVSGITASGVDPLNPLSNAFDQKLNTRWSNLGLGSWIQVDLGQEKTICSVGINWHRGDERINTFVISSSTDGKTFTDVFSGKSEKSLTEQSYKISPNTARFIRVTVTGNTQNNWVSIAELKIYDYKLSSESCATNPIVKATSPNSQQGYPPTNAIDGNPNTVWSSYGIGSSILLNLGTSKNLCSVDIAWYKGNERQNNFVISTSLDGISFKTVLTAKSTGSTLSFEKYVFADNYARYVKITVNGNTQNNYASISEARVQVSAGQNQDNCSEAAIDKQNLKTSGSQTSFPVTNVVDKDLNTRWSNFGIGSWIQLDMGTIKKLCSINVAWYNGNERQNNYVISTSNDGLNFNNVLTGKSSGTTSDLEKYNLANTNARYIRITVNGNTLNEWASITEVSADVISVSGLTFDIGAAGDWGSSRNDNWKQTVQLMKDNDVELALGLGDYSYGTASEFKPVVDSLKQAGIPMRGAHGDHDSGSYEDLFVQPSMEYAFDAGTARIILLDSYKSPSVNAAFLEKELIATKQPWKIVVVTTPLYTSPSTHAPDKDQTNALQPLLDKYKVDLVMWGDNHNYERIKFPDKPTLFIQSGTAGRSHYSFDGKISASQYQNDKDYGFTNLKISSSSIEGQFIAHSGKVLDTFTITK